ncbi:uncharacterized protein [Eurosta solidaginis]|uniref:uncharacterized protein n=1 Tax=Eurosta solidaginis TaxID=178769 RepID=UPI0035306D95
MKKKVGIAGVSKFVAKLEHSAECGANDIIQTNAACGHQNPAPNKQQISQERSNVCVIFGDGDIQNSQLSDEESGFEGFASLTTSSTERNSILRQRACTYLENKDTIILKDLIANNAELQRSFLNSMSGSVKNEAVGYTAPDIKRRNMSNELEESEPVPVDKIIEIDSNSTTSSEEYKRKKINPIHQFRLFLRQQTLNSNSHNNKCSTETTSDFPVSSPSNPHDCPGSPQKNKLPADSFERSLALLTAHNPQMTLEEKISSWKCDQDLSDVEDVGCFDDAFKQHEELKQKVIHGKKKLCEDLSKNQYNCLVFHNKVLPSIKASTSFKEKNDTLSNCSSLSAQRRMRAYDTLSNCSALSAQRRMRAAVDFECKKRQQLGLFREHRSITPTITSSSEKVYNSVTKPSLNATPQKNFEQKFKDLDVDHLQSEIGIPQLMPLDNEVLDLKGSCKNKVINKNNQNNKTNAQCLIEMRLDFAIHNKSQHLHEKRNQLFKTPTVPPDSILSPAPMLFPNSLKKKFTLTTNKYKNTNVDCQFTQQGEYHKPMEKSLRKSEQNCSAHYPRFKATTPAANFHQQHEFCNYLGLTGMSTANAVANAVAELAKCNLTRRSLRVHRLKQQERKDNNQRITKNTANDYELVQTPNDFTLNHGKNAQDVSENIAHKLNQSGSILMDEGSESAMPIVKNKPIVKEPEIKVVCKISNSEKEKSIERCAEELSAPGRQTLFRYLKVDNSNDTSTCPRSSISDVDGEMRSNPSPNIFPSDNNNFIFDLPPTAQKSVIESDPIKKQLYEKFKKYLDASRKKKPSIYIVQTLHNADTKQHTQPENKCFVDVGVETSQEHKKSNDKKLKVKRKVLLQSKRQQISLVSKQRKEERLRKLLALATSWHKGTNYHRIRNRKIVLLNKIKSTHKTCEKATKKRNISNQSEHFSTASLSKSYISTIKSSKSRSEKQQGRKSKLKRLQKTRVTSRTTPSPADTSIDNHHPKTRNTVALFSSSTLHNTPKLGLKQERSKSSVSESILLDPTSPSRSIIVNERLEIKKSIIENETVVVSSTTNSYDEATLLNLNNNTSQVFGEVDTVQNNASRTILTKDISTQSVMPLGIHFLNAPSKELANPTKTVNGQIDYVYYEMDVLIVVQEKIVSFWKYFKLINVLAGSQESKKYCDRMRTEGSYLPSQKYIGEAAPQWLPLGECRRLTIDMEISTSYANRICVHNSIPIYIELRCREIPHEQRDCNLLSMYINVYYFNDEEMIAKIHSIQLDTVQGLPSDVIYTTITESRYFVMSWPQENILGKPRSGLCKYSLTPNLDTLASIRDFKHMRHRIRYLECSTDDKLIGFGDTQLTIWDHRSGDVLMNYDFNINLGQNIGSIYYPSLEIGQNSMLLLFQYVQDFEVTESAEVIFIACTVSHTSPSHRILNQLKLPNLAFNTIQHTSNTGDNIIITAKNDEEIWINCTDPTIITTVPPQNSRRFYPRGKSQIIELTSKTLTINSFANHVLKLAAKPNFYCDKEST